MKTYTNAITTANGYTAIAFRRPWRNRNAMAPAKANMIITLTQDWGLWRLL